MSPEMVKQRKRIRLKSFSSKRSLGGLRMKETDKQPETDIRRLAMA